MCNDITFEQRLIQQRRYLNDPWYVPPVDFSNCNLRGRDFSGQDLRSVNFSGADLEGAIFDRAVLKSNQMLYTNVNRSSFRNCKIVGVVFIRASIKHCIFTGAEILDSTFNYADLTGTDLGSVYMNMCDTTHAILDNTPHPDRFVQTTNVQYRSPYGNNIRWDFSEMIFGPTHTRSG